MFQTQDLIFRKVNQYDLDDLLRFKKDSWAFTHHVSFLNECDQQKFFQSNQGDVTQPNNVIFVACESNFDPIGIFWVKNIDYISRSADASWGLYSPFRGKKLGYKLVKGGSNICFQVLNLRRISCEILSNNIASMKCAVSAGFVQEGTKRESVFKQGKYVDSMVFGLLSEEFNGELVT